MRTTSTTFTSRVKKPHGVFEKVKTFMTEAWVLQKNVENEAPKAAGLSLTDTLTIARQSRCSQFRRAVLMVGLVHSTGDQETEIRNLGWPQPSKTRFSDICPLHRLQSSALT